MKKRTNKLYFILNIFLLFLLNTSLNFAQPPQRISYQAVLRDTGNIAIANSTVSMQISILQGSATGTVVYSETQTPTTLANGLISIEIGNETGFDTIDWALGSYFIHTETDPAGGINYTITGTSQLLTVPYALQAKTAETVSNYHMLENRIFNIDMVDGNATLFDIDGNEYPAIKIGNQIWMTENLRVRRYNNGAAIPHVTDETLWSNLVTGAYGWYVEDSAAYDSLYGKLYNWYAVNTDKLCPANWHVPSDNDWDALTDFLTLNGYGYQGSGNDIAKSMATTTGWATSAIPGAVGFDKLTNNSSGFSAMPGGMKYPGGAFGFDGSSGYWWSSIYYDDINAIFRSLSYNNTTLENSYSNKKTGYSVRCIKN